ncbi:hypothetical protein GQ600_26004 [Phytophthora cactorum]|nr:hypothetical protein GQ600_26004 [Phytophthora cactorum]
MPVGHSKILLNVVSRYIRIYQWRRAGLFRRWGGVAAMSCVLLKNVIAIADVNWLVDACGKLDADDAQQEIYKRLYVREKQKHLEFISTSDGIGALACSREVDRFEFGAWSTTVRHTEDDEYLSDGDWDEDEDEDEDEGEGGDHDMDADDDVAMEESLPEQFTVVFTNENEISAADATMYLRPAAKNYKSVTGPHKYRFKQAGQLNVLDILGNPTAPRLFFVLPPDRFTVFRYQRYLDLKRKRMQMPTYRSVR